MKTFVPFNRHVLVELIEEEEEVTQSQVLLPTDYKKAKSPYVVCKVLDHSDDCKLNLSTSCSIVVQRSMIEEIEIADETYYLVLENYVYGSLVLEGEK
jgi:co-chaperonin GroES (HSP10)